MKHRRIRRGTIIQPSSYPGEEILPLAMLDDLREIAAKGYHAVEIFPVIGEHEFLRAFCPIAAKQNLEIWVLTNYMKYSEAHLAKNPEQRIVMAEDGRDQDGLNASNWGCPFHPDFKARGFEFLREIARQPGVTRVGINDEAMLLSGCYCAVCKEAYRRDFGGEMPLRIEPCADDWQDETWRNYLQWKMARWNRVHTEQAEALKNINPEIKVLFQSSPACDLWLNPWQTGVDLTAMVEELDGLSTDPYYTFHPRHFDPAEVYLSEWSRFLRGIVPPEKEAEIVVQGFSHPTFTRPMGPEDGYWSALVPIACGVDFVTPFTYPFQKCSPMQQTYEACFALDQHFEMAQPLAYAGVVHGGRTEIYGRPLPVEVPHSYDWTRMLPVAEALRHQGLPYSYLPDRRLDNPENFADLKVLLLPEINCLSDSEIVGLKEFFKAGGNAVILGNLGNANETGAHREYSLLEELFGIHIHGEKRGEQQITLSGQHAATQNLPPINEARARNYLGGSWHPVMAMRRTVEFSLSGDAQIIAEFADDDGEPNGDHAILVLPSPGRVLWWAGFPSRNATHPRFKTNVINRSHALLATCAQWCAGEEPCLRVEGWPPEVPIQKMRPFDPRFMPSFEFFPLRGENTFIGLVTSYFKEPASFRMTLDVPFGKKLKSITELIQDRKMQWQMQGASATFMVELSFDTCAKCYLFELED